MSLKFRKYKTALFLRIHRLVLANINFLICVGGIFSGYKIVNYFIVGYNHIIIFIHNIIEVMSI